MYGREQETHLLLGAFEQILEGQPQWMMVQGYAGVGKSFFISQLHESVLHHQGFFLYGHFELFQQNNNHQLLGMNKKIKILMGVL